MPDKKSNESRRKLLKSIAAGSSAVIAGKSLPENWTKPVVDSVLLPAHAETSPPTPPIPSQPTLVATVNLDSTTGTVVSEVLAAGTYTIAPVSGTYVAWNAWSNVGNVSGCDASGENCATGFIYSYTYNSDTITDTSFNLGPDRFETTAQALAAAQAAPIETFTLPASETVNFRIGDSNYGDNFGGVSIEIYQMP